MQQHTFRTLPKDNKLAALAKKKNYVRVTGWFMFDGQHKSQIKGRATVWEVHPITGLEVCTSTHTARDQGQDSQPLEQFQAQ